MVGDYGGGAMFLAFGVVCALLEAQRSGSGQIVDAAMVDGTALLMTMFWTLREIGAFDENAPGDQPARHGRPLLRRLRVRRRHVRLDRRRSSRSSTPNCYSVSASTTTRRLPTRWIDSVAAPQGAARRAVPSRTREEWCALLDMHRRLFRPGADDVGGSGASAQRGSRHVRRGQRAVQPAPAPRFSRTPATDRLAPAHPGEHSREILADWGLSAERIEALVESGAVVDA